jgi:hypothetical protein
MGQLAIGSILLVGVTFLSFAPLCQAAEKTAAERGRDALIQRSINPAVWSMKGYDNAWKAWGLAAKPANYEEAFRDRYGLHAAPFDNKGRPMGLLEARNFLGKGIVNNCLLCHAGTIAGQTYIGLGNSSLELQALFEELSFADGFGMKLPFQFSYVRGTIDPVNPLAFLMGFRDPELNLLKKPVELGYGRAVCSDPPAWWLIKKKKTRDWTGSIDARSTRVDMVNLLTPLNTSSYIKAHEKTFADISAFLLSVESPRYPFAVDKQLASQGESLFLENCAKCHGTYGTKWTYPNKIVPLSLIGTDRTLADSLTPRLVAYANKTWFTQEIGADGHRFQLSESTGYQAPPLDGIWATAPYFHNGSAPTVYHVLNPKARPKIFTRSYRTGKEDYDTVRLGWQVTVLDKPAGAELPGIERRKIYDTSQPSQSNSGHVYGDKLTDDERMAVIEYLKTL